MSSLASERCGVLGVLVPADRANATTNGSAIGTDLVATTHPACRGDRSALGDLDDQQSGIHVGDCRKEGVQPARSRELHGRHVDADRAGQFR